MIYLTGDIHGVLGSRRLAADRFPPGRAPTEEDMVIVLGDFGLLWSEPPTDREASELRRIESLPWTTLFLDGNHENFTLLNALPEEERWGAPVGVVSPRVLHLKRGYVYTLQGKRCFVLGGAASVDRAWRIPGRSWWREEIPSLEEFARGRAALERAGWSVDWILTHTAPNAVLQAMDLDKYLSGDPVSDYLDELCARATYNRWYCGHLHRDRVFDDGRFVVVGEGIVEGESGTFLVSDRGRPGLRERLREMGARRPREGD